MSRICSCAAAVSIVLILSLAAASAQNKAAGNPIVALDTGMGTIKIELFPSKSPVTARNFLSYVNMGFYDGTIVHRIDFVIGLGGYTENLTGQPTLPPIKNESRNGLKNLRGTVAMARYDSPDSATSQFFINLKDNAHLDPPGAGFGYAVFGKVVAGMDVVDKIAKAKTGNRGQFSNIPLQTILVKSAKVISQ